MPRCRCRCGGALHGIKRGGDSPARPFYEALPDDDPHHLFPKRCEPCKGTGKVGDKWCVACAGTGAKGYDPR